MSTMNLESDIRRAVGRHRFARGTVHVWKVRAAAEEPTLEKLVSVLSPEEKARAQRFHFEKDRRCYQSCHGFLRLLLAAYSGRDANAIDLRYGPQGKPALDRANLPASAPDLQFNLSHSGELALFAFAPDRTIGVDLELMRPDLDFLALAAISFSEFERQSMAPLAPNQRASLFYEYWSCKEACIKADGRGLSVPTREFSIVPGETPDWRAVAAPGVGNLASEMRIRILDGVGTGYAAAVASPSSGWEPLLLDLPGNPTN